jgi:AsmA family protein
MREFFARHRKTKWTLIGVGSLLLGIILVLMFFDWNLARGPISRMITANTGRPAAINGNLRVHLWSWNPTADVEGLTIGNPDWAKNVQMFGADKISITVSLGRLLRGQIVLPRLEIDHPVVDLERDAKSRASWEFTNKQAEPPPQPNAKPTKLPTLNVLVIKDGKVDVDDRVKKLTLHGSLNAGEQPGTEGADAFQLRLTGTLNAKPLKVDFNGGPLINLNPKTPYDFNVSIVASTIHVSAVVSIVKPFDLSEFTAKLHVSGDDLADAYYLTGLALPNTAKYDIAGDVHRTDADFQIDALRGQIGASDISGTVGIDTGKKRLLLKANLTSKNLNIKDLAPSLGAEPTTTSDDKSSRKVAVEKAKVTNPQAAERLLPDADLQLNRVRAMDADVTYHAATVTAPKLPMKQVEFHIALDNGDLKINPLSFVMQQGAIAGSVDIDARKDVPETSIDMHVSHVDLSQFKSAKATDSPLAGDLHGRLQVHGTGSSIHKLAATADGKLGIAIPQGQINEVLAELLGVNVLKGLGLLFSNTNKKTDIRCGVIDFQAAQGALTSKTFFIDTTNVLVTGRGHVNLDSEAIDLTLQGDPKKVLLLRLRAPVLVGGTLSSPKLGVKPEQLAVQTGAAVALGVLLTPVASVLAFVDPGLAKDKNCAAVLGQESEATGPEDPAPPEKVKKTKTGS